jgi:hypothetical protein
MEAITTHPELIAMRKEEIQKRKKRTGPVLDDTGISLPIATQHTTPKQGEPIKIPVLTKDQFFKSLEKATRRRKTDS